MLPFFCTGKNWVFGTLNQIKTSNTHARCWRNILWLIEFLRLAWWILGDCCQKISLPAKHSSSLSFRLCMIAKKKNRIFLNRFFVCSAVRNGTWREQPKKNQLRFVYSWWWRSRKSGERNFSFFFGSIRLQPWMATMKRR